MNAIITIRVKKSVKDDLQAISDRRVCHVSDLIRASIKDLISQNKIM